MSVLLSLPIKTAIYVKATIELIKMQMGKARRNLGFVNRPWQSPLYIFLGSEATIQRCQKLSRKKGMRAEFMVCGTADLQKESVLKFLASFDGDSKMMQYVVFDTATFSYDTIFAFFSQRPSEMRRMAFFHPDTGKLITDKDVLG